MLKVFSLGFITMSLVACGNLSNVTSEGTTDNPIFPKIDKATFNHDGNQLGSWVNWDNVRQIERGMNKDQLYNLIGRPHFSEGLYQVREWDYIFNYRENGEHKICQYKILFDKNMNAQSFYWYPNGCNGNASFSLNSDFLFDFDKDVLTRQGEETVLQLANNLKSIGASDVRIEGHTDRMGTEEYNLDLSSRRAERVKAKLIDLGVEAKFKTIGLGEEYQIKQCDGNDQAAKDCLRPNRRVEVFASGNRVEATIEGKKEAGANGPSALYDKDYPYNVEPYPEKLPLNLQENGYDKYK